MLIPGGTGITIALCFSRVRFGLMAAMKPRQAKIARNTKETRIAVSLNLDGQGKSSVKTGIPFFDHMLTLFAKHAVVDLQLRCAGDLEVDAHHTVEDCGIVLGQAFATALGDKRGIRRYGSRLSSEKSIHRRGLRADGRMPRALRH